MVDVHKRFGDGVALNGAGFSVESGQILGFLGPNGAGRTTMMRVIFDLVRPDSGEVRWRGKSVDDRMRLTFGYMPEERGLYPKMKVGGQLVHFARLSGLSRGDAHDAVSHWLGVLGLVTEPTQRSRSSATEISSARSLQRRSHRTPTCSFSTSRSPASIRPVSTR